MYDKFAAYYDIYSAQRANYLNRVNQIIINYLKENVKINLIVDLGSGTGKRAALIAREVKATQLVLVDESKEMSKICKKIANAKVINIDFTRESLSKLLKEVSVITSLWNVFGHLDTREQRTRGLKNIHTILENNGLFIIDVNNRYNASSYGWKNILRNFLQDLFTQSDASGDISFEISVSSQKISAKVHLFSPWEMDTLLKQSGFKVVKKLYINYNSGNIENQFFKGQILYICKKS